MRIIYLVLLTLWVILPAKVSMSNPNQICFFPEPGDTNSFGSSVAINDKYLAIGDPNANYVIIYTRDNFGQWIRRKKIFPPKDSIPHKVGNGFGQDIELNEDVLVITAATRKPPYMMSDSEDFVFTGRYLIKLNTETKVKPINLLQEKEPRLVRFNLLSEGKIRQIVLSDNGEEQLGRSVALHQNLLIVGSPSYYKGGGAWLFSLEKPDNKPIHLTAPNIYMGETVAISAKFAAVGVEGYWWDDAPEDAPRLRYKTLVRAIKNGSTTVIDSYGKLSLNNNILAVMLPGDPGRYQKPLLKVYSLDDKVEPSLITERTNITDAFVQNDFLVTVLNDPDSGIYKVCLESIIVNNLKK